MICQVSQVLLHKFTDINHQFPATEAYGVNFRSLSIADIVSAWRLFEYVYVMCHIKKGVVLIHRQSYIIIVYLLFHLSLSLR